MIRRASPLVRNAALAVLALLFLWFAWSVRSVLNPLIAGYFLAFCVHPFVQSLERLGWSRKRAVNTIFVAVGLTGTVVALVVFLQARKLVLNAGPTLELIGERADDFLATHQDWVQWVLERIEPPAVETAPDASGASDASTPVPEAPAPREQVERPREPVEPQLEPVEPPLEQVARGELTWRELLGRVGRSFFGAERGPNAGLRAAESGVGLLRRGFGTGFALLSFCFLLPIYTWFLLFELESIHRFVRRYIPRHERQHVTRVGARIGEVIASFFRGRLTVCLLKGAILVIGLAIARVDYAVLLGLAGGFLSLVPFIGPFLTCAVAFLLSLPDHGFLHSLVAIVLVFIVAELVEGYVLIPKILGDSLGLHPVVVLLSVFVGGAALGLFGFLIAIPLTAALIILAREFLLPMLAQFADEDGTRASANAPAPGRELWTPGRRET